MADTIFHIPTRQEVESLQAGDMALDGFGKLTEVVEISYRGVDIHGKAFVGFYVKFGDAGSKISHSYKEDELVRTVATSRLHTSWELDDIESQMLAARH